MRLPRAGVEERESKTYSLQSRDSYVEVQLATKETSAQNARARALEGWAFRRRTEARAWVVKGRVKVNGEVTRNPELWIDMQRDRVRLDGRPLEARERVAPLLGQAAGAWNDFNKDPKGRPTVYDLVAGVWNICVAGRPARSQYLGSAADDQRHAVRRTRDQPDVACAEDVSRQGVGRADRCTTADASGWNRIDGRHDARRNREAASRLEQVHALRDHAD